MAENDGVCLLPTEHKKGKIPVECHSEIKEDRLTQRLLYRLFYIFIFINVFRRYLFKTFMVAQVRLLDQAEDKLIKNCLASVNSVAFKLIKPKSFFHRTYAKK